MPVDDLWHLTRPPADAQPCGKHGKLVASGRHGRGKRWRVRYTDPDGDPKTEAFERQSDAEAFDLKVRSDVQRGEYVHHDAGKVTVEEHVRAWLEARTLNASTRETMARQLRKHVYPTLGPKQLRDLARRPTLIREWHKGLTETLGRASVRLIFSYLSAALAAAVEDGLIPRNPCQLKTVKPPRPEPRKVVPWEQDRVVGVRSGLSLRYQAMADAGAGAGLRQGEVFGLALDDFDWLRFNIHVCRQVKMVGGRKVFAPPKFEKERDVPLSDELAASLAAHLQQFPAREVTLPWKVPDGKPVTARLLFTTRDRNAICYTTFNIYAWKPALVAAGIIRRPEPGERYDPSRDQGFHQLRHYYASVMLAEGVAINELAEFLGHEDAAFTLRTYVHLMQRGRDRGRRAAGAALRLADAPSVPVLYRPA